MEDAKLATRKEIRDLEQGTNYFFEFVKLQKHYFHKLEYWLRNINDPRDINRILYGTDVITYTMVLKNVLDLRSMRSLSSGLNNEECINNVKAALGLDALGELPHYDTINDFLSRVEDREIENIRTQMIKELLKKRSLEAYRIKDKYWGIIFDGTGLFSFKEKHCEHCLKREHTNKETGIITTTYMHHVLEAKLVIGDMVLSIGSEFIENESEDVTKQDCELKAFSRLAAKIKKDFGRLPICVQGDSLYACETVFAICDNYKWKYLMRFKEGRIKSIADEFAAIKKIQVKEEKIEDIFKNESTVFVNGITYRKRTVNVFEANLVNKKKEEKQYTFITNLVINKKNVNLLVHVGRSRWKIENEGFNNQKKIRYAIEHVNCECYQAMKNHYLLTQIADILMQLFENGAKLLKFLKKTAKEMSSNLFEAIRSRRITDEDTSLWNRNYQVRFT